MKADAQWYVIYTKGRNEKKVADLLNQKGFEAYCPVKIQKNKWTDRIKIVEVPLFNSYCFVKIEEHRQREIFFVPGVVRYVYWLGRPAIIREVEIETIKQWLNEYENHQIEISQFTEKDRVVVKSGVFENHEAIIEKQSGNQIVLRLEGLGFKIVVNSSKINIEKLVV